MRLKVTFLLLCLSGSLLAAGAASANRAGFVIDKGIVQSVTPGQVVLRALDGSTVSITIGPRTRVFLNDTPASLTSIQPGYVAGALHDGSRPAVYLRAVAPRAPLVVDKGIVVSVTSTSITLRTLGGVVTDTVGPATTVLLNGEPAAVTDLRPGYVAEVAHRGTDPALQIRARGSRR